MAAAAGASSRHKALLLLALAGAQAVEDVEHFVAAHPNCFHKGFQYTPDLPGTNTEAESLKDCQRRCRQLKGCSTFAYFPFSRDCYFADWKARMVESPYGAIAGHGVCPDPTATPPGSCRTELPRNGFPGEYENTSNQAWPAGRQPWSLECWPKNWTGGYIPCQKVTVLQDSHQGWPGKCRGLAKQSSLLAYNPMDPTTKDLCKTDCERNPLCASWQIGFYGECWQGVGRDCLVRENFNPQAAQRLQHGEVRVLMDLAGWHIIGLTKSFDNREGFFERVEDAVEVCKMACYSDIRCQFWQYSPRYGCYVEDPSQGVSPAYPLTLDWAYRSTSFALDCVAGEFIQHYCPDHLTTAWPTEAPAALSSCMRRGVRYEPPDMAFQTRSVEMNAAACQLRCKGAQGCRHFAYWPDGGCHLQDSAAKEVTAEDSRVISGPASCEAGSEKESPQAINATAASETNWFTKEGEEALNSAYAPVPSAPPAPAPPAPSPPPFDPLALRVVEIRVPIENLDLTAVNQLENRQLQMQFKDILSRALALPVSSLQGTPEGEEASVSLLAEPPTGSAVVAYLPRALSAEKVERLQASLQSPNFSYNLESAAIKVLGSSHGAVTDNLNVANPSVKVVAVTTTSPPRTEDEDCNFLCKNEPVILGCVLLTCLGGLLAGFLIFRRPPSKRKSRSLVDRSDSRGGDSSPSYSQSDFDSRMSDADEGDASIWAEEPSWDDGPADIRREVSIPETYSRTRGDTIFEA